MLVQLFLNSLFRNKQILKRIDYVLHILKISDPIWNYLKVNNQLCMCSACLSRPEFKKYDDYYKEVMDREYKKVDLCKKVRKTEYCEVRTINAHQQYASILAYMLFRATSEQKIAWVKSKLGKINHSLTNQYPDSKFTPKIKVKVLVRGFPATQEY